MKKLNIKRSELRKRWEIVKTMLKDGYTQEEIAEALGYHGRQSVNRFIRRMKVIEKNKNK